MGTGVKLFFTKDGAALPSAETEKPQTSSAPAPSSARTISYQGTELLFFFFPFAAGKLTNTRNTIAPTKEALSSLVSPV